MTAFVPQTTLLPRTGPRAPRIARTRPPLATRRRHRASVTASYSTDLETRARDVAPAATDALVARVEDALNARAAVPRALLEEMVVHLADSRGMSRLALVEAFGLVGPVALPTLLEGIAKCPNPVVRRSCGKALAKIGDPAATPVLIRTLLHDEDTVTRSSAAGALAKMGKDAVPSLLDVISDPATNMTAKGHAAWAISFMQGDAAAALFESVRHPSPDVRIAVISALGAVAIGDALPTMAAAGAVGTDDWGVSDAGVRDRAIDAMRTALADTSPGVRAEAATALANAGCTGDAGAIADMLGDEDGELRRCAALALMKLGAVEFVERIKDRADDESECDSVRGVARLAAESLGRRNEEEEW